MMYVWRLILQVTKLEPEPHARAKLEEALRELEPSQREALERLVKEELGAHRKNNSNKNR